MQSECDCGRPAKTSWWCVAGCVGFKKAWIFGISLLSCFLFAIFYHFRLPSIYIFRVFLITSCAYPGLSNPDQTHLIFPALTASHRISHPEQQLLQLCVLPFRPTPAACFPTPALALITARNHIAVARQHLAVKSSSAALSMPLQATVDASSADASSSAVSALSSSSLSISSATFAASSASAPSAPAAAAAAAYLVDFESRRATAATVASRLLWAALHLWRMPLTDKLLAWVLRAHAAVDNASAVAAAAAAAEAEVEAARSAAAAAGAAAAAAHAHVVGSDARSTRALLSSSAKAYASSSSHAIDAWLREARRRRLVPTVALFDRLVDVVTHAAILGAPQCRRQRRVLPIANLY
jgi:hypothetical protein